MKDVKAKQSTAKKVPFAQKRRAPLNVNTAKSLCLACGENCQPGNSVVLKNCQHNFCVNCLQTSIRKEVVNVKCPNHKNGCVGLLTTEELKELFAPHELNVLMKKRNSFDVTVDPADIYIPDKSELDKLAVQNNIINAEPEHKIQRLEKFARVPNIVEFKCPLCSQLIGQLKGIVLRECLHSFCTPCLLKHVHAINNIAVKCPFKGDSYACERFVQQRDMRAILPETEYTNLMEDSMVILPQPTKILPQPTVPESADSFCCGNCLSICDPHNGYVLTSCGHQFCQCCLIGTITSSKTGIVICYFDDCKGTLSDEEIRGLLNDDQARAYDKILVI